MVINKRFKFPGIQIIVIVFLTVLDQYTKSMAVEYLMDKEPFVLIPGVLELRYLENRGAAFGVLQDQKILLIIITVLVLFGIIYLLSVMPGQRKYTPLNILLVFVASGAVGNLIDRIANGYVVDFIYFSLIDFPIFNMADIYVTTSMILIIFFIIFYYREDDLRFLGFKD